MPSELPSHSQRLHDLKGIQADFKALLRLVRSGYRFDDEDAAPALAQLEKALSRLDDEIRRLEREWPAS